MGGDSLQRELDELTDDIRNLKRKDMLAKMTRNEYVNDIEGNLWSFDSAIDDLNQRLVGKVQMLNAIIMKYDTEAAATMPKPGPP